MNRTSILALIVFVVLAGLVLSLRLPAAQRVQAAVIHLVRPLHTTTTGVGRSLGALGNGLKSLEELEKENEVLTVENAKLRATNELMNDLAAENNTLREALEFKQRSNYNLLPARIVSRQSSTWWNTVQIDRGEQDGLDSDMPVVTDVGLVGKTTTVAPTPRTCCSSPTRTARSPPSSKASANRASSPGNAPRPRSTRTCC